MFDPYGVHLGPQYIYLYALILMSGTVSGHGSPAARPGGVTFKHIRDAPAMMLSVGMLVARRYHGRRRGLSLYDGLVGSVPGLRSCCWCCRLLRRMAVARPESLEAAQDDL